MVNLSNNLEKGFEGGPLQPKGGLILGSKKGGGSLQPAKKSQCHYNKKKSIVKKKIKKK